MLTCLYRAIEETVPGHERNHAFTTETRGGLGNGGVRAWADGPIGPACGLLLTDVATLISAQK
jgi:hypothetical protein